MMCERAEPDPRYGEPRRDQEGRLPDDAPSDGRVFGLGGALDEDPLLDRYEEFLSKKDVVKRLLEFASRFAEKKASRVNRGGMDFLEGVTDLFNEGLRRVIADRPDVDEKGFIDAFRKKLDNRDRQERRSLQAGKIRLDEPTRDERATDENILPWREPAGPPDRVLEHRRVVAYVRARLTRRTPHLLGLFDLYLSENWGAQEQCDALQLDIDQIYTMRAALARILPRIAKELREGDE